MIVIRIISMAIGYILGIILAANLSHLISPNIFIPLQICGLLLSIIFIWQELHWKKVSQLLITVAVVMFILPLGYRRAYSFLGTPPEHTLRSILVSLPEGSPLKLRGIISKEPDVRRENRVDLNLSVYELKVGTNPWQPVKKDNVRVRVQGSTKSKKNTTNQFDTLKDLSSYGYTIEIETIKSKEINSLNPHQFDNAKFIRQSGYAADFKVKPTNILILEESRGNPMLEVALAAKSVFLSTYRKTVRDPASRLVAAASLGTRRAVEKQKFKGMDISLGFRHIGIGHVLAVSGLHVTVISVLLYFIFAGIGLKPRTFAPVLIFFLLLFAMLTGARPSSMRAVIMNAIIISSIAYFKLNAKHATYIGLSLSSFLILLFSPLVLFSASFLLSFGAVLSLVLITPTTETWLRRLRGFSLILSISWFSFLVYMSCYHMAWITRFDSLMIIFGTLGLLNVIGNYLNNLAPRFWRLGIDCLPKSLQVFMAAQLAIQIGMMIPMSAFFFGRFPVAGIFANLIIIPAVGILVQLGMMAGLLGMIPFIGTYLALPFGASATIVAYLFFWTAYIGQKIFPYPGTPKPSITWLIVYFSVIGLIVLIEHWHHYILDFIIQRYKNNAYKKLIKPILAIFFTLMVSLAVISQTMSADKCKEILIAAKTSNPVVIIKGNKKSLMINASNSYIAQRTLFNLLRGEGICEINSAILTSPNPNVGLSGILSLGEIIPIRELQMGIRRIPGNSYLESIKDPYLLEKAEQKTGGTFQKSYNSEYHRMEQMAAKYKAPIIQLPVGPVIQWQNMTIENLPLDKWPRSYISSAKTAIIKIKLENTNIAVITETTEYSVKEAFKNTEPVDIIIITDHSNRSYFMPMLRTIKELTDVRTFIFTSTSAPDNDKLQNWCKNNDVEYMHTGFDGMIKLKIKKNELDISTWTEQTTYQDEHL